MINCLLINLILKSVENLSILAEYLSLRNVKPVSAICWGFFCYFSSNGCPLKVMKNAFYFI